MNDLFLSQWKCPRKADCSERRGIAFQRSLGACGRVAAVCNRRATTKSGPNSRDKLAPGRESARTGGGTIPDGKLVTGSGCFDNPSLPKGRRFLPDSESPSVGPAAGPIRARLTSQAIRASPALGYSTNLVFQSKNLIIVPAKKVEHSASALYISALKDGPSEDYR